MLAPLPFAEAIDFHKAKVNLDTDGWDSVLAEQHDTRFVVAGAKGAVLQDFRQAIDKAIAQGVSLADFLKDFDNIVATHGWDYQGDRNWRAGIIFNTNLRQAYTHGRYQQMQATRAMRPYWQWRHRDSRVPRPTHLALDGKVFPSGSKFWDTHFPSVGYGCKCSAFALSDADLEREGLQVEEPPDDMAPEPGWGASRATVAERRANMLKRLDPELQRLIRQEVAFAQPEFALFGKGSRQKEKKCKVGKVCGYSCINKDKECRKKPPKKAVEAVKAVASALEEREQVSIAPMPEAAQRGDMGVIRHPGLNQAVTDETLDKALRDSGVDNAKEMGEFRRFVEQSGVQAIFYDTGAPSVPAKELAPLMRDSLDKDLLGRDGSDWRTAHPSEIDAAGYTNQAHAFVVLEAPTRGVVAVPGMGVDNQVYAGGAPRFYVSDKSKDALISYLHEVGHQVHYEAGKVDPPMGLAAGLSEYSKTNKFEFAAEHIVAYVLAPKALRARDKAIYDWVEGLFKEALSDDSN
jgi:SPP1 gp7 family putative phage head morphogenesis protein